MVPQNSVRSSHTRPARRLDSPLSSAGALITLLILVVDPFTQQIIHYQDCGISIDSLQGTIPRTDVYLQRYFNQSFSMNGWVEPGLQTAIKNSVASPSGVGLGLGRSLVGSA